MVVFVDTSILVRAYLVDEPGHEDARQLVFDGHVAILACELARVEMVAALRRAERTGRLRRETSAAIMDQVDGDLGGGGPVIVLRSRLDRLVDRAIKLVVDHPLRTLDALHLACADIDGRRVAGGDGLAFHTADTRQRTAARAMGLTVVTP